MELVYFVGDELGERDEAVALSVCYHLKISKDVEIEQLLDCYSEDPPNLLILMSHE